MQNEQVDTTSPTPHQDENIDMQLETFTPEHGDISLQLLSDPIEAISLSPFEELKARLIISYLSFILQGGGELDGGREGGMNICL